MNNEWLVALPGESSLCADRRRALEFGRQALHAQRLKFMRPVNNRAMSFESPLPEDFQTLLNKLRASSS